MKISLVTKIKQNQCSAINYIEQVIEKKKPSVQLFVIIIWCVYFGEILVLTKFLVKLNIEL